MPFSGRGGRCWRHLSARPSAAAVVSADDRRSRQRAVASLISRGVTSEERCVGALVVGARNEHCRSRAGGVGSRRAPGARQTQRGERLPGPHGPVDILDTGYRDLLYDQMRTGLLRLRQSRPSPRHHQAGSRGIPAATYSLKLPGPCSAGAAVQCQRGCCLHATPGAGTPQMALLLHSYPSYLAKGNIRSLRHICRTRGGYVNRY